MRCPTCRRPAEAGQNECARCGTDLSLLIQVAGEHDRLVRRGRAALADRKIEKARRAFENALALRKSSVAARKGLALVSLVSGRFAEAVKHKDQWT